MHVYYAIEFYHYHKMEYIYYIVHRGNEKDYLYILGYGIEVVGNVHFWYLDNKSSFGLFCVPTL